jgi:hypothetical protein
MSAPFALAGDRDPGVPLPDPRGPIEHPGTPVRAVADGVEAKRIAVPLRKPKPAAWNAPWVGPEERSPAGLFRQEFTLEAVPGRAPAYLSADASYRLWVNGKLASRGPADIGMDYHRVPTGKWFYDVCDIAPYLHPGKNVVTAEVFFDRLIGWEGTIGHGGFLCEVEATADNGESRTLTSASAWKTKPATHWRYRDQPTGHWQYDGEAEPAGWRMPGFDVSGWSAAVPAADGRPPLVMSEIPPRMEAIYPPVGIVRPTPGVRSEPRKLFPLILPAEGGCAVRYERVMPAFIGITVRGGRGGTLLIQPNEPNAPGFHRMASIALSGREQTVELPFLDSFSVLNLKAVGNAEPVEILDIRATFASQPVTYRGAFECSDAHLTRLWHVCRWATQICLQTHHLDSPHHQEPISDPGDYLIESLVNYCAFMQPALTRQDLRKYAWILGQCKNHCFHTSYSLLWLQMLLDYYDHTGDEALVRELAPNVHSLLDTFTSYRGTNGLISNAPNYMFMDWVDIAGFPGHHPPAVIGQGYMTAFYYRGLADAARVAACTGDNARQEEYARLRTEVAAAFERELWVEGRGLYRDGKPFQTQVAPNSWLPADKEIETFTTHVNILAVLYDLAPQDRQAAILEKAISGPDFTCQPYFMHFALSALAHAGLFERHGVAQMHRWQIVEETQSLREMWNVGDLSHGWGATPLYQMSARILGVRPAAPGSKEITVSPLLCGLEWAKGRVPIPAGDVSVEWQRKGHDIKLAVAVPKNCRAHIELPAASLSTSVVGGRHQFAVTLAG